MTRWAIGPSASAWSISSARRRAKIAAAVLLMAPGVPLLFQGEEWAASSPFQYFTAHEDPELGRAVSEGRRREFAAFGWEPSQVPDPQDVATFERSRLDWDEVTQSPHADMLAWYRDLIALRRASSELRDGDLNNVSVAFDESAGWLKMTRGALTLALNLSPNTLQVELSDTPSLVLTSDDTTTLEGATLRLPSDAVAIVRSGA